MKAVAVALGVSLVALPAQALTPQEQVNLGIGLQVAGCALGGHCRVYVPLTPAPGFGYGTGVSPGLGVIPYGAVIAPGFGTIPYGTVVSPGFGAIPYGTVVFPGLGVIQRGVVVSPGLGLTPYRRTVVSPRFGVRPQQRGYIAPRRLYDARAEIDQIYREVLGRPADLDGLRTYQARFDEGWSLQQIRNDIANSLEARSRW